MHLKGIFKVVFLLLGFVALNVLALTHIRHHRKGIETKDNDLKKVLALAHVHHRKKGIATKENDLKSTLHERKFALRHPSILDTSCTHITPPVIKYGVLLEIKTQKN